MMHSVVYAQQMSVAKELRDISPQQMKWMYWVESVINRSEYAMVQIFKEKIKM